MTVLDCGHKLPCLLHLPVLLRSRASMRIVIPGHLATAGIPVWSRTPVSIFKRDQGKVEPMDEKQSWCYADPEEILSTAPTDFQPGRMSPGCASMSFAIKWSATAPCLICPGQVVTHRGNN